MTYSVEDMGYICNGQAARVYVYGHYTQQNEGPLKPHDYTDYIYFFLYYVAS